MLFTISGWALSTCCIGVSEPTKGINLLVVAHPVKSPTQSAEIKNKRCILITKNKSHSFMMLWLCRLLCRNYVVLRMPTFLQIK